MNDASPPRDWTEGAAAALVESFADVFIGGGARTPFVDCNGALAQVSATDLGIHAARAALARSGIDPGRIGATFAGSCAQSSFDACYLPRQVGLYSGVPADRPALGVHRLCTTGFEVIAQAARGIAAGTFSAALCAGAESMSRNPVAAYTHRGGFRMGKVEFADFLWESTLDTSVDIRMGDTAENLAAAFGITRAETDAFAARSFARAVAAQAEGRFAAEIAPIEASTFAAPGCAPRGIRLPRGVHRVENDSHIRPTEASVLATLPAAFGGVQTGGNSSAIVDGAAAVVVGSRDVLARAPLAQVLGVATAAVAPAVMGIGPVPAITAVLHHAGLALADLTLVEVNEAFGAQAEAVRRALDVPAEKFNVNGGAIAFGHPLAATGIRCVLSLALELARRGGGRGIAAACAGGGQGMAVLFAVA